MEPSDVWDSRSSVWQFVEEQLPLHGLYAVDLPLEGCVEEEEGHSTRGLWLFAVRKARAQATAQPWCLRQRHGRGSSY